MAESVPKLNRASLPTAVAATGQPPTDVDFLSLPERVVQFGEGGFLRGFVDWMIEQLNLQRAFNGRVAVVQPIATGFADTIGSAST